MPVINVCHVASYFKVKQILSMASSDRCLTRLVSFVRFGDSVSRLWYSDVSRKQKLQHKAILVSLLNNNQVNCIADTYKAIIFSVILNLGLNSILVCIVTKGASTSSNRPSHIRSFCPFL